MAVDVLFRSVGVLYYRECHFVRIDSAFSLLNKANLKSYYKTFLKSRRETVILSLCEIVVLSWWLSFVKMPRVIGEVKACYIKRKEEWTILKCALKKLCHFNSEHPEDFVMCTISYCGKKTSTVVKKMRAVQYYLYKFAKPNAVPLFLENWIF